MRDHGTAGQQGVDEDFEDFVSGAYAGLSRTAALLAGSRVTGEDLLHEALLRTYLPWGRIEHGVACLLYPSRCV